MRITKFGHACVRLEHEGVALVIDPGVWTEPEAVDGATAVLVTHEHPDHLDVDHLRAAGAPVFTIEAVAELIRAEAPGPGVSGSRSSAPGEQFDAGLAVRAVGELHAVIHPDLPRFHNSGYVVTAGGTDAVPPRRRADRAGPAGRRAVRAGVGAVAEGLRGGRLRPLGRVPRATSRSTTGSTPRPASGSSTATSAGCSARTSPTSGSPEGADL